MLNGQKLAKRPHFGLTAKLALETKTQNLVSSSLVGCGICLN